VLPIAPLAPGLLSTITFWPNSLDSFDATARATTSVTPPGGNGTTSVIAREG
jgi:hypothetical protein